MLEIIRCLKDSEIVSEFQIQIFELFEKGFLIKIKALLKDSTELYIREYVDTQERNYSYHWQDASGNLIIRWDNAFHHKNLPTFPYHVHMGEEVLPTDQTQCSEILKEIEKRIQR